MMELIKINYEAEQPTVSARELHEFLGVGAHFKDWFPRMCEYGFTDGIDFCSFLSESTGGRPAQDAALTVDMAKELCMIQRTDKGKQARQYFLVLEKAWNTPEQVFARALKMADQKINQLKTTTLMLEQKVAEYEPKAQYVDNILKSQGVLAAAQIAADYGLSAYRLNKILHEEHIQYKVGDQWILYREHMNLGYTKSETIHFERSDGRPDTKMLTKWTQKGRLLIHNILENRGIMANMDRFNKTA